MTLFKESIYENEYLRRYIKDKELAKTIGSGSSKKLEWVCDNCGTEKIATPSKVKTRGFYCSVCSKDKSYPERLMTIILNNYGIEYEEQKKFEDCINQKPLPFDFYIEKNGDKYCIEMHGEQHYYDKFRTAKYNRGQENDIIKEKYCRDNNIKYVEINCSKPYLDEILDEISKSKVSFLVEKVNKEDIRYLALDKEKYDNIDIMIKEFNKGTSFLKIEKKTGVPRKIIVSILKRVGVYEKRTGEKGNGKKVICLNNKMIFDTVTDATNFVGLKQNNNISMVCNGKRKYAGTLNGEKCEWMFYHDYLDSK